MRFYLGTHKPNWLANAGVPLFVSARALAPRRTMPVAVAPWALDSGGFTEIAMHGHYETSAEEYVQLISRVAEEIGQLDWAAPQDWMCEPAMLERTGLTVTEHQLRTIESVRELRALGAPVIPVLQGWDLGDYLQHVEDYDRAGIDLRDEPVVGVGTICRRNDATGAVILRELGGLGIRLHAFGAKGAFMFACVDVLVSADSLAWSYNARRNPPMPGCKHKSCSNCQRWALAWRRRLLARLDQLTLLESA